MPRRWRPSPPTTAARWPPTCWSISDRDGGLLAAVPTGAGGPTPGAVTAALGGREVVEFRPDAGGVLQVATVPIAIGLESPDVLGTVSVGVRLDAQMAGRFKRATRSEVAFALDGAVRAATVPPSTWHALQPLLGRPAVSQILIDDSEYVGRAQPLGASGDGADAPLMAGAAVPTALVLQSRTERLGFLRTVYAALALAAATAVLLAVGLSYAVARTITRPLGRDHGDDARGGDHRRPDAEDPAARAVRLAGRGRASAGDDLQHAHRLGGALSARSVAEGTVAVAGPAVDGHRARSPQPADDHQGGLAQPAPRGAGRRHSRSGEGHRRGSRSAQPDRARRARLRQAAEHAARAGRSRAPVRGRRECRHRRWRSGDRSGDARRAAGDGHRSGTAAHGAGQRAVECATGGERA